MKITDLIKQGDDYFNRHQLAGDPDWQSLHATTPDDTEPDEDAPDAPEDESNSADTAEWLDALGEDLRPLGLALERAMMAGDEPAMRAAVRKISVTMPEFANSTAMEDLLEKSFITALITE